MSNRLSHSSINRYLFCPEAWKLHYKDRIRPIEIGSALVFGSAIGKALEYALAPDKVLQRDFPNCMVDAMNVYDYFDSHWNNQEINNVMTNIKTYPHIAYSKYDTDFELLSKKHFAEAGGDTNLLAWFSLQQKAYLIIDSFKKNLLPLITKVHSTEEKIELGNDEGDSSIGYADAVVDLIGYDKPVILDFKTAAWEYEPDSVQKSVQLSQYIHVLGEKYDTRLAGYAVFLKNIEKNKVKICKICGFDGSAGKFKTCNNEIYQSKDGEKIILNETKVFKKRCNGEWTETMNPECKMQLIVDTLPEAMENFVVSNIENVNNAIKANIFVKNVNGCYNNGFNRPCEFVHLCHGADTSKYVKLQEKTND